MPFILASQSQSRQKMLADAGLDIASMAARIDEDMITAALIADGMSPRDISDALAEAKAQKIAAKHPADRVLGSDQVLSLDGTMLTKPTTRAMAKDQLQQLQGQTHQLFSAAVLYDKAEPIWRVIGEAKLTMHKLSEAEIDAYLDHAWPDIANSVGGYHAEALGAQLFRRIDGDWFSVLGLPLLPLLTYLRQRGWLTS